MNTNFSKQMALLGAAVTTFVAGCNKQDELNTSFTETPVIAAPVDRVIITPEVVVLPTPVVIPLVQQDRSYKSRDSITVVSETGKLEISHKSVQPEGRVIASLLDYMTDQLGFEIKLTFTAVEGYGNELPANSLTLEISPQKNYSLRESVMRLLPLMLKPPESWFILLLWHLCTLFGDRRWMLRRTLFPERI